jgi:hypothetical protein
MFSLQLHLLEHALKTPGAHIISLHACLQQPIARVTQVETPVATPRTLKWRTNISNPLPEPCCASARC